MRRVMFAGALALALVGLTFAAKPGKPAKPPVKPPSGSVAGKIAFSDDAVAAAIKKAQDFLLSKQNPDGSWAGFGDASKRDAITYNPAGPTALIVYALLESGIDPQDPRLEKALKWLASQPVERTYTAGLIASAWQSANLNTNNKYVHNLESVVDLLIHSDNDGSYWYFTNNAGGGSSGPNIKGAKDNSNSQYGLLGVWAGARNDLPNIPREYWERVLKYWIRCQDADGGWKYGGGEDKGSTGPMTAAGLASMFVCYDYVYTERFTNPGSNTEAVPANTAIKKGLEWFDKNFVTSLGGGNMGYGDLYYYLYGVERVGLASGMKYFGQQDWYKHGVAKLLENQDESGAFRNGHYGPEVATSYALLFLVRGRASVMFNKLEHENDWNNRPRDLATLTRRISYLLEVTANWQSINLQVPVHEWHDAPILYIAGSQDPKFTEDDLAKLREYAYQGGMILSVTEGGGPFGRAMKDYYTKIFPDYELTAVPADHPLYNLQHKIAPNKVGYHQITNGIRTLALHMDEDLPKYWQLDKFKSERWAFDVAVNLYLYVAEGTALRSRGTTIWPDVDPAKVKRTVKVVRLQHGADSDPEPLALDRLSLLLTRDEGIKLDIQSMSLEQAGSCDAPLAVLTGTQKLAFGDEDKAAIKKYVEGGGTLAIDAAGGNKEFAASVEEALVSMYGMESFKPLDIVHPLLAMSGHEINSVTYRRQARLDLGRKEVQPKLNAVFLKDRPAIIYSQYDITGGLLGAPAYNCAGYTPKSAYQIMRNIILFAANNKK